MENVHETGFYSRCTALPLVRLQLYYMLCYETRKIELMKPTWCSESFKVAIVMLFATKDEEENFTAFETWNYFKVSNCEGKFLSAEDRSLF
jgi:hypothetical protein